MTKGQLLESRAGISDALHDPAPKANQEAHRIMSRIGGETGMSLCGE
jgi:hypothetical protein